jgi:large-conductance mechanosensitive channel
VYSIIKGEEIMFNIKEIINLALGIAVGIALGKLISNFVPSKAA